MFRHKYVTTPHQISDITGKLRLRRVCIGFCSGRVQWVRNTQNMIFSLFQSHGTWPPCHNEAAVTRSHTHQNSFSSLIKTQTFSLYLFYVAIFPPPNSSLLCLCIIREVEWQQHGYPWLLSWIYWLKASNDKIIRMIRVESLVPDQHRSLIKFFRGMIFL